MHILFLRRFEPEEGLVAQFLATSGVRSRHTHLQDTLPRLRIDHALVKEAVV